MHVLHIANDYAGSSLYAQLVSELDSLGTTQTVFTTIRTPTIKGRNAVKFQQPTSIIHYSENWRSFHRLLFRAKTASNYRALCSLVDMKSIDYVHAHTLFSDGVLALKIKQRYGIPYTVAVRSTDVVVYMRYMVNVWWLGRQVLSEADYVVFISPAHLKQAPTWVAAPKHQLDQKSINIPNGIDRRWLDRANCSIHEKLMGVPWKLICVGSFQKRKNIPRLMKAVLSLNSRGVSVTLDIVGSSGCDTDNIFKIAKAHPEIFTLHGEIRNQDKLRALFLKMNIFVLPSTMETFGLVYVEALTQGLPILYSEGVGVDGYFDTRYGRACNPYSIESIAAAITQIMEDYPNLSIDADYLREHFDWEGIAKKYISIYNLKSLK